MSLTMRLLKLMGQCFLKYNVSRTNYKIIILALGLIIATRKTILKKVIKEILRAIIIGQEKIKPIEPTNQY